MLNSNLAYNEWQSLAAKNGLTLWYRKNATNCEIRILGICTVSVNTTGFVLGTLPVGYRSEDYICFSYVSDFYVRVRETGAVEIVNTGTSVVNQSIRFSAIYGL